MRAIIEKILRTSYLPQALNKISLQELNEFVEKYVEATKGKPPTADELKKIVELISKGFFKPVYAAEEYAKLLGYDVVKVQDSTTGEILRIDVYEKVGD